MKKAMGILGGFILLIALTYFVILPKAAEYVAGVIPVSIEESIGESVYDDFTRYSTKNVEKSDLVNAFFQEMNLDMSYDYRITVVNKDEVNAFALPAGQIVVYSEILNRMNSYEELAAVLAHEYSHVELRHSLKSIFRSLSGSIMLAVIFGGIDGGSIIQNAHVFSDLQYSRKAEREADLYGLDALVKSGIDPEGMVKLFKTLGGDDKDSKALAVSEFMSTHPLFESRIKYIEEYMESGRGAQKQFGKNETLEALWQQIKKTNAKKVWK